MARYTKVLKIEPTGKRDAGKSYFITEMDAHSSFKWGCKAVLALINAGVNLPDGSENLGMAGLVGLTLSSLKTGLKWEEAEPLMDELMTCVRFIPDPAKPDIVRDIYPGDIEEFTTIALLHSEVLKLHINFT